MGKLGGEFQRTDVDIKDSTMEGRSIFLRLVAEITPNVYQELLKPCRFESLPDNAKQYPACRDHWIRVFLFHTKNPHAYELDLNNFGCQIDVRKTPFLAYFDYVHKSQAGIDRLIRESEEYYSDIGTEQWVLNSLVAERTMREFIPGWKVLQSKSGSKSLRKELNDWARKFNLEDDWCLDFAIDCLHQVKTEYFDRVTFPDDYLKSNLPDWEYETYWVNGKAWRETLLDKRFSLSWRFIEDLDALPIELRENLEFRYEWPRSLRVGDQQAINISTTLYPNSSTFNKFETKVREEFWTKFFSYFENNYKLCITKTDEIACEIKKFDKALKKFLKIILGALNQLENVEPTVSKDDDNHFRWLVDYQIKESSYSMIARKAGKNNAAVIRGVKSASEIIKLRLRKPAPGGRPKGSRTKARGTGRVA